MDSLISYKSRRRIYLLLVSGAFFMFCLGGPLVARGQGAELEVLRVGLSRIKGTSLLTVVLNQTVTPQVFPVTEVRSPRLVVVIRDAQGVDLPSVLPGDQELVRQLRIMTSPGKKGVRVILELFPDHPYVFWRQLRPGPSGRVHFLVGLKSAAEAEAETRQPPGLRLGEPRDSEPEAQPVKKTPAGPDYSSYEGGRGRLGTEAFQEIGRLAPNALGVLRLLEQKGWSVVHNRASDQPGQRVTEKFLLTQSRYPTLTIRFSHIAGTSAVSPDINFITLSTDNISGSEAERYRAMRQWSTKQIKQHYEDIGDYYDDGLKPLRIILRERSKASAIRDFDVFRQFLQAACPQEPQLADQVLAHIREKVNKRLEGVQYTISENPLVILNMVDLLYLRVYFLKTS